MTCSASGLVSEPVHPTGVTCSVLATQALFKMLDARQLGLKLIANVTYGYTGANFSGRMPCIEVGVCVCC